MKKLQTLINGITDPDKVSASQRFASLTVYGGALGAVSGTALGSMTGSDPVTTALAGAGIGAGIECGLELAMNGSEKLASVVGQLKSKKEKQVASLPPRQL